MMEFKRTTKGLSRRPDMTPMVDVIFFMLIFFMLFSTLQSSNMSLDVELPRAVSGTSERTSTFEISVSRDGAFYVENRMVTGPELKIALEKALASNPELFVIIKGDKQARYEHIVAAMDHVKELGTPNLGLAVEVIP